MKITIINGKGGVGKSTFTIALGSALAEAGYKVGVIDRDPQKTATHWIERLPNLEIVRPGQEYTSVIIDTPPRLDSNLLHTSLRESDVAVLITSPSPADLWTSKDTKTVIDQYFSRPGRARILFNKVQSRTKLSKELDFMAEQIGLPALTNFLSMRQVYQHAAIDGWKALSAETRDEVFKVALEIMALNN